jgi:hypothetical protein
VPLIPVKASELEELGAVAGGVGDTPPEPPVELASVAGLVVVVVDSAGGDVTEGLVVVVVEVGGLVVGSDVVVDGNVVVVVEVELPLLVVAVGGDVLVVVVEGGQLPIFPTFRHRSE